MPVIVRSATLLCVAVSLAFADAHDDVVEVFTRMAAALTEANTDGTASHGGNVAEFMSGISKDMPDYDTLKNNVTALVNNAEISSSVEVLTEEAQGDAYKVDLDWVLEIRSLQQDGPLVRRREVVHCQLTKEKKRWKIVALKPVEFFAPPALGK